MKMNWKKNIANTVAMLILTCATTMPAAAQTADTNRPPEQQQQNPSSTVPPPAPPQAMPNLLTGVDADKVVRWTLQDAIAAALEKNPDIEIGRRNVRLAQFDILAAEGFYDQLAYSTISYNS